VLITKEEDDQLKKLDRLLRQTVETMETETGLPSWVGKPISPVAPIEASAEG
jgi:hypothetical protein